MTLYDRFKQLGYDAITLDSYNNSYEWEISSDVYELMKAESTKFSVNLSLDTIMGFPFTVVDILPYDTIKLWNRETNTVYVECKLV